MPPSDHASAPHAARLDARPQLISEAAVLATGLGDAACRGLQPAFDAEVHGETPTAARTRLDGAIEVCRTCPVVDACDTARRELPSRLVRGVWAGRVYGRSKP